MDRLVLRGTVILWPIRRQAWLAFEPFSLEPAKRGNRQGEYYWSPTSHLSKEQHSYQFQEWPHHAVNSLVRNYEIPTVQSNSTARSETEENWIFDASVVHQLDHFMEKNSHWRYTHSMLFSIIKRKRLLYYVKGHETKTYISDLRWWKVRVPLCTSSIGRNIERCRVVLFQPVVCSQSLP